MALLRFGTESCLKLELANGGVPAEFGTPVGQPLADPAAAVAAAVVAPLEYPPLALSTTPGDKIVLTPDCSLPHVAQLTATVIQQLIAAGVEPDGITVLRPQPEGDPAAADPLAAIGAELRERIGLLSHDPNDRRQLAYLAANEAGEPILVNRALHEADLVLPIAELRDERSAGYFGIHGAIFPTFSDVKTQHRFRAFASLNAGGGHKRALIEEADHAAWLLGVNFTIQLLPAAGDGVLHVLAGESEAVRRRGRELYRDAWAATAPSRAALVVAGIEGGPGQQTWENLGRALQAAEALVEEDGAIAVCCEVGGRLGPAMQRLSAAESPEAGLRHVAKDRPADALPAAQLVHALQRDKVYLLSRLEPTVVEDLDIVPIANTEELVRLAQRYPSCILLSNAAYATVAVHKSE